MIAAASGKAFSVVAGDNASVVGFVRPSVGTLDPDLQEVNGFLVSIMLYDKINIQPSFGLDNGAGPAPLDDASSFNSITVSGTFAGGAGSMTLLRSDRILFNAGANDSTWEWNDDPILGRMVLGNTYGLSVR